MIEAKVSQNRRVSLVIPGRNCRATLRKCLDSVAPLKVNGQLEEIYFVDDGSADDSSEIAAPYSIAVICGQGLGPGHARNLGWRVATSELIWFIDSDCVANTDTFAQLLKALDEPDIMGAGGSYWNLNSHSLLATTIDCEIQIRHQKMPVEVDFLGGFNVVYLRRILEEFGGFDERDVNGPRSPGAEDCDLSFRISQAGYRLHFVHKSMVGHHHPTRLIRYLRTQLIHGYWRARLYAKHPGKATGDAYSGLADRIQPLAVLMCLPLVPFSFTSWGLALLGICCLTIILCAIPLAIQMARRDVRVATYFLFLSSIRSVFRMVGFLSGSASCWIRMPKRSTDRLEEPLAVGVR